MIRPIRVPATFVRGGTSKAVLFKETDLLGFDLAQREAIALAAIGSPDPYGREIDGLGGGISSTSKVGIVGGPDADGYVTWSFGQVDVEHPRVEFKGTCGNISAAIGPFAVDEGLVEAVEPFTRVPVLSLTSGQRFIANVPVRDGRAVSEGDYEIDGVPGRGARIGMEFLDPGGSLGRGVLPSGMARQRFSRLDGRTVEVSLVDAAIPLILVRADALEADSVALPEPMENQTTLMHEMAHLRATAVVALGLASDEREASERCRAIPKIAMVGPPAEYRSSRGRPIRADQVDLVARMVSMERVHRTYALTAAICTAVAASVDGTVARQVTRGQGQPGGLIRIGHPAGTMDIDVILVERDGVASVERATAYRTARRIMDGWVEVPRSYLEGRAWFQVAERQPAASAAR